MPLRWWNNPLFNLHLPVAREAWLFHDDRLLQQYEELWNHRFWQHSEYPPLLQVTFPQLCNKKDVFKIYINLLPCILRYWKKLYIALDTIVTSATYLWAFFLKFGPSPDLDISCTTPSRFTSQCLNISYKIFPLWLIYFASQCVDIRWNTPFHLWYILA